MVNGLFSNFNFQMISSYNYQDNNNQQDEEWREDLFLAFWELACCFPVVSKGSLFSVSSPAFVICCLIDDRPSARC